MPVIQAIQAVAGKATLGGGGGGTVMVATYDTDNLLTWYLQIDSNPATTPVAIESNTTRTDNYTYPGGSTGSVYTFNGGNSYMIGPSVNFLGTSEFAINFWFYPTTYGEQLVSEYEQQDPGSGYHYVMLEVDSSGHVRGRVWPNSYSSALISANTVNLNHWNHLYFFQNAVGSTYLKLNNSPSPSVATTAVREPPGGGLSNFAFGVNDVTAITSLSRFSGKIGRFSFTNTSGGNSDWDTYKSKYIVTDTGITLGPNWTVEVIAELIPTSFWATIWGNEVWNTASGHIAYLTSINSMEVGGPAGTDTYNLSSYNLAAKTHWAFTHTDGGNIKVYRNGTLLTKASAGYAELGDANNTLLIGARHMNSGTGTNDYCDGTYYYYNITQSELDATAIQASYNSLKNTYGLP